MTAPVVGSTGDGGRVTVSTLIGNPLWIPTRIIEMLNNAFLTEAIFRNAGRNTNGLVGFEESVPLYLEADVEDIAEGAEIPIGLGKRGMPRIAIGVKRGLGVRVTREMRDENKLDDVQRQIRQLVNTHIRAEERALRAVLMAANIPSIAATAAWDGSGAKVRHDIALAQEKVATAAPDPEVSEEDLMGFEADAIILPGSVKAPLLDNEEFLKVYQGNLADQNIAYTGRMPGDVMGLAPLLTRFWPKDRALVLVRNEVGFRSDTRPLESTPLYGEGGGPNGGPTETWRSDTTRKRVLGVDQPLAACWITGIQSAV